MKGELGPLLTQFDGARRGERDAVYPFWALERDGLWEVAESAQLPLTSDGRRPTFSTLEQVDPLAGLPEQDYDQLVDDPELAAQAINTLLVRFFAGTAAAWWIPSGCRGSRSVRSALLCIPSSESPMSTALRLPKFMAATV